MKDDWDGSGNPGPDFYVSPEAAEPYVRRIAELERELDESARLHGMGAEREARLEAKVTELERERDELREERNAALEQLTLLQRELARGESDGR